MDVKTKIFLDTDTHSEIWVQESVDEVKKVVERSEGRQIVTLTLGNGNPVYLLRGHITWFTEY